MSRDYIQKNLMTDEYLIGIAYIHRLTLLASAFAVLLCIALLQGSSAALWIGLFGVFTFYQTLLLLGVIVDLLTTEFSCTNTRIVIRTGFLGISVREMPLAKVETLLVDQGFLGKLLEPVRQFCIMTIMCLEPVR